MSANNNPIILITGAGGMGTAIAKRLSHQTQNQTPTAKILLADFSPQNLVTATTTLKQKSGLMNIETFEVDVSSSASVKKLAEHISCLEGRLQTVIHTAGLSPVQSSARKIYEVDLLGTANVLEIFLPILTPPASIVCIASIAGYMLGDDTVLSPEQERSLATAPAKELLTSPLINLEEDTSAKAYALSKRANHLRVQAASLARKGVRVNSISPGTIDTPMLQEELAGASGEYIRKSIEACPVGRVGMAEDVAEAVAFLVDEGRSGFVNGTDLVVDGGYLTAMRFARGAEGGKGV